MVGRIDVNHVFPVQPAGIGPRIRLTTSMSFYVATNGSDSNNGLTSGAPWLTFAHAMAVITGQYDFGGQAVTLQAVAAHAAFTTPLVINPWSGAGALIFDGASGSITATAANAITINSPIPGRFTCQNVTLSCASTGDLLNVTGSNGSVLIGSGVTFGSSTSTTRHISAIDGGYIQAVAPYTISGGGVCHWFTRMGGRISVEGLPITLSGTPNFNNAFALALYESVMLVEGCAFSGSATGTRFNVAQNSLIYTGGAGPNYLPGNAAGIISSSSGGQYQ